MDLMTDFVTTSRGDRVGYDRYGTGPGLVFVSGAGPFRAQDPATTATALLVAEAGVTTVAFDRLGRGDSAADGRLDLDRELEALRAVLDVAGGHAVLCGHSSGCSISLAAAARGLPVDGLVLWEAPVAAPAQSTAEWIDEFERLLDARELEAAQEWYMKDMPAEWLAGAKASPAWPAIYANAVTLRADGQSVRWATAALESGALRAEVTVPVLSVYGTSTFPGMVEASARIRSVLPQTEVREVPGAHHAWEPAAFAPVLAEFVRSAATAGHQAS
jgi:pimeloyl-ACP methyl ester carboxylesterase